MHIVKAQHSMKQSAFMALFCKMELKEKWQITLYILSGLMSD